MTATNEQLIGRDEVNDLEAILSVSNHDSDAVDHHVDSHFESLFTWNYDKGTRARLERLYEKAKTSQWNGQTDLPWEIEVDQEAVVEANRALMGANGLDIDVTGTPFEHWSDAQWLELGCESQNWMLSQFLHGEQGALLCTARIVETVPWIDAKYYAATQVMDEARHVEVFGKYLNEKLSGHYPVNAHLGMLLDDIIADSRWDMTYLGMQIMVEGLALAAFGFMHETTTEPLLKQLLRYVMADEARHVAFGARSSHSRPRSACGTASSSRRSGSGSACRSKRPCRWFPALRSARCSSACCSPRSFPTARSSACSTTAIPGCGTVSPSSESSSSSTSSWPEGADKRSVAGGRPGDH